MSMGKGMIINHSRVKNAEVTHISRNGLILMVGDKEYYLPYGKYPWFKRASVDDVFDVRLLYCIERFNACSLFLKRSISFSFEPIALLFYAKY